MQYGKTSEYWEDRALETEAAAQQYADQAVSAACEGLSEARDYILKKIRSIYARFHKLTGLTMEQVRSLLTQEEMQESNADLEKLLPYLKKDSRQALLALLDRRAFSYRLDQLTDLQQAIEWVLKAVGQRIEDAGVLALKEAMEDSYMRTLYAVQRGTGLWWPSPKYSDRRIQKAIDTPWLGSSYSQRVWTNVDKTARQAQTAVIAGMSAGMSQRDMRDTLVRLIGDGGVQPRYGAMARANTLIRSEVSHLSAQAQMDGYQESGISRYIFLAALDGVTCLTCQSLDGKDFPVEEASTGENLPPLHPRCRCTTKPYISGRDYSKMKRRARDPETGKTYLIPADVTYEEWKRDFVERAAIWKVPAQDTDDPVKSSDKTEDSSGNRNFSLKQNSDYRKKMDPSIWAKQKRTIGIS